jgi:hypothetical protein
MRNDLLNRLPALLLDYHHNRSGHRSPELLALHDEGDHDGHNVAGGAGGDIEGHYGGDIEGHLGGDPGSRFYTFVHRLPSAIEILNRWRNSFSADGTEASNFSSLFADDAPLAPSAASLGSLKTSK